jgi:hypothetical protein
MLGARRGLRSLHLDQSSSASRFTAGASGFFDGGGMPRKCLAQHGFCIN